MFGTSTASAAIGGVITDVGTIIGTNVPLILTLLAALIGLGWGVRKFRRHVSGKAF